MSPAEAKAALPARPPDARSPARLEGLIRYEQAPGVHTFHDCRCGRGLTRAGRCAACLREMLQVARETAL